MPFKFISLFQLGKTKFDQWYETRGKEDLMVLEDLEAAKIMDNLHIYFARDLLEYLSKKGLEAVILIDTYEALWETNRTEGNAFAKDQWIRDLIQELPEVLWVICGREKLRWEELDTDWQNIIEPQLLIGELSQNDSKRFLASCGIQDELILNQIYDATQGLPFYLNLAVDKYERLGINGNKPLTEEFAKTPRQIFDSFIKNLNISELETLKVLSITRY